MLLSSKNALDVTRTYRQIKEALDELAKANYSLQNGFATLMDHHKQICKDVFIFEAKDWVEYSKRLFDQVNNEVAKHGVAVEDKYKLKY